jgi:hypothetical protein
LAIGRWPLTEKSMAVGRKIDGRWPKNRWPLVDGRWPLVAGHFCGLTPKTGRQPTTLEKMIATKDY